MARIEVLSMRDFIARSDEYDTTKAESDKCLKKLKSQERRISIATISSLALIALQFLITLLVFICIFTLAIGIVLICYAQAKKILSEKSYKEKLLDFHIRKLEMKQAHELNMARLRLNDKT